MVLGLVTKLVPKPSPRLGVWANRLCKLCYLAATMRSHRALKKVIESSLPASLRSRADNTHVKYLRAYLARYLTTAEKYACLLSHHRYWHEIGATYAGNTVLLRARPIWQTSGDGHVIAMELRQARRSAIEGELALNFLLDGLIITTLTFSFVPGTVFGHAAARVLFVGGVQGYPGCREAIRQASRLNFEIAPARALLIATQALAAVLDISTILCIAASQQIAANAIAYVGQRAETYDALWRSEGAACHDGKVYALPSDLSAVIHPDPSGSHRTRARRRRLQKEALYTEIKTAATTLFPTIPAPSKPLARESASLNLEHLTSEMA